MRDLLISRYARHKADEVHRCFDFARVNVNNVAYGLQLANYFELTKQKFSISITKKITFIF